MIWLFIILLLLASITGFVLLTPLIIKVDTAESEYSVRWRGIAGVSVVPHPEEILIVRYNIFFLKTPFIRSEATAK